MLIALELAVAIAANLINFVLLLGAATLIERVTLDAPRAPRGLFGSLNLAWLIALITVSAYGIRKFDREVLALALNALLRTDVSQSVPDLQQSVITAFTMFAILGPRVKGYILG